MELQALGREGVRLSRRPSQFHFSWSAGTQPSEVGLTFLNEAFIRGSRALVSPKHLVFYLHADDGVCFGKPPAPKSSSCLCGEMAETIAEAWEEMGFLVPERSLRRPTAKALGFEWEEDPGLCHPPWAKAAMLQLSFEWQLERSWVCTGILKSLVGIWIWMASVGSRSFQFPPRSSDS